MLLWYKYFVGPKVSLFARFCCIPVAMLYCCCLYNYILSFLALIPSHFNVPFHSLQSRLCKKCGSLLSPMLVGLSSTTAAANGAVQSRWMCRACSDGGQIEIISVPYVFRYLVAELAAMNIRVELRTT